MQYQSKSGVSAQDWAGSKKIQVRFGAVSRGELTIPLLVLHFKTATGTHSILRFVNDSYEKHPRTNVLSLDIQLQGTGKINLGFSSTTHSMNIDISNYNLKDCWNFCSTVQGSGGYIVLLSHGPGENIVPMKDFSIVSHRLKLDGHELTLVPSDPVQFSDLISELIDM